MRKANAFETILFISPSGYGLVTWQPIVERLCQEFRIITMDPRGTGRSDPIVRPYTSEAHARDIAAVVRAVSDGPIVGVGVSAAPAMLIRAAVSDTALFKQLVLLGGNPGTEVWTQGIPGLEDALAAGDFERVFQIFVPIIISESGTKELVEQRLRAYRGLPNETVLSFFGDPEPTAVELRPLLEKLTVPTLVMHGTADLCDPFEDGQKLAELIPRAQFYPFEGRCHLCMLTATQEFCDVLREFVQTGKASRPTYAPAPAAIEK